MHWYWHRVGPQASALRIVISHSFPILSEPLCRTSVKSDQFFFFMFELPPPSLFPELSTAQKIEVLDHLFEPCPTLADLLLPRVFASPYTNYGAFIETSRTQLLAYLAEEEKKAEISPAISKIISAHPRLGPSKDKLSSHSNAEQKSLAGTQEEAQKLAQLNDEYEKAFPGLRYVVFVNGRSREVIMENMTARIERGDIAKERVEAFNAMCDIAIDRARKLGAKL